MKPKKIITLQGNVPDDKCEVEVWDGCLILTTWSTHPDAPAGECVLLVKEEVDKLKVQLDRYYDTLREDDLLDDTWRTEWYDEQEEAYNA